MTIVPDGDSRRQSMTLPNGVNMAYGYDAASQLTGITYTLGSNTLGNLTYAYDLAGRRMNVGGSFARTGVPQAVSSASYNANNQLTNWKGANLTYDANGNLTNDGTNTYHWNARNQLEAISGAVNASFQYDAFGRRVSKTISATTQYLYDGVNPVQEISGTSASANLLTGGVDQYFQRTDSAGARSFLTDALGSTLALSDSSGTTQTSYTFEPFGNTTTAGSSTTNSFAFTGRELDPTGLYFYRARYYSPAFQRFISEDPIGMSGSSANLYAYTQNAPTNSSDPSGMFSCFFIQFVTFSEQCDSAPNTPLAGRKQGGTLGLETKAFFQALGHNFVHEWNEGCVATFKDAVGEPLVATAHATEQGAEIGLGLIGVGVSAGWLANELYPMLLSQGTGPKLDPFLGPVVVGAAKSVASTAGRIGLTAEELAAEFLIPAALVALDLSLAYGLGREFHALWTGECQ